MKVHDKKGGHITMLPGVLTIQEHRTQHYSANRQLYEKYAHWKNIYREYQAILTSGNNEELLAKALAHGEINLIEYLMETGISTMR